MVLGAIAIVWLVGIASHGWGTNHHIPWLFASFGASALLVVCTPSSPMAQPWPVIGGGVLSAAASWGTVLVFTDPIVATSVAVGMSIMVMVVMRCLHPPGAAVAMWVALERIHNVEILLYPVATSLVALVLLATVYNRMTGKRYPAPQHSQKAPTSGTPSMRIDGADLDAALARFNGVLDVSRADLEALLQVASQAAFKRTLGDLRCEDIMARPVYVAQADMPVEQAWENMQAHDVKALPVVNAQMEVQGIVTSTDLLKHALAHAPTGLTHRLKSFVLRKKKAEVVVEDLMTPLVAHVQSYDRVVELIAVFSQGHLRHLPVVNAQGKLVGMVTQTDLIRAMAQSLGSHQPAHKAQAPAGT